MAQKYYPFYNVSAAVGPGASNATDDVMLVQFFLREIAKDQSVGPQGRPPTPLTVDGVYGPNTAAWIAWFQNSMNAKFAGSTYADGRVDPARGMSNDPKFLKSTISHTQYTIVSLNATYRFRYKASHNALDEDPRVPQPLRQALAAGDYA